MNTIKLSSGKRGRLALWLVAATLSLGLAGSAVAGISATKHNLTAGSGNKTSSTDQICVFCHTPHAADTSKGVPLWNKTLPSTSYTTYDTVGSSSLDGATLSVGSVSLACLSCHDGTQAMDNVINAPGSGLTSATAGYIGAVGNWSGSTQAAGKMTGVAAVGAAGDLSNDHPIGIQYCGGGLTATGTGTCNDEDFVAVTYASINAKPAFWVETGGSGRQKTDIALYTRDFSAKTDAKGVAGKLNTPSVECGSCHDPHVDSKGSDNVMFMRVTTAGSAICLSCHVK